MKKLVISAITLIGTSTAAFAADCDPLLQSNCDVPAVPEINAYAGVAAVAVVAAVVALIWERRRKAA